MDISGFFSRAVQWLSAYPDEIVSFFKKGLDFKGREKRGSFFKAYFAVFLFIALLHSTLHSGQGGLFMEIVGAFLLGLCFFAVVAGASRRLRDAGKSPWLILVLVVSLGAFVLNNYFFPGNDLVTGALFILYNALALYCTFCLFKASR